MYSLLVCHRNVKQVLVRIVAICDSKEYPTFGEERNMKKKKKHLFLQQNVNSARENFVSVCNLA